MNKASLFIVACLLVVTPVCAEVELPPQQVIDKEGELVISDGSSYYTFKKDGQFLSGPINGISGRTIAGKWEFRTHSDPNGFVVTGLWGWVNGTSPLNDFHTMTMAIYSIGPKFETYPKPNEAVPYGMEEKSFRVYKCYFIIESIEKTPH